MSKKIFPEKAINAQDFLQLSEASDWVIDHLSGVAKEMLTKNSLGEALNNEDTLKRLAQEYKLSLDEVERVLNGSIPSSENVSKTYGDLLGWFRRRVDAHVCLPPENREAFETDIDRVFSRLIGEKSEIDGNNDGWEEKLGDSLTPEWLKICDSIDPYAVLNAINSIRFKCRDCLNAECRFRDPDCPVETVIERSKQPRE